MGGRNNLVSRRGRSDNLVFELVGALSGLSQLRYSSMCPTYARLIDASYHIYLAPIALAARKAELALGAP